MERIWPIAQGTSDLAPRDFVSFTYEQLDWPRDLGIPPDATIALRHEGPGTTASLSYSLALSNDNDEFFRRD